jgi:hypothetical protein
MQTTKNETVHDYTAEMQHVFYAEELESRFEMAVASPNLACWITDL